MGVNTTHEHDLQTARELLRKAKESGESRDAWALVDFLHDQMVLGKDTEVVNKRETITTRRFYYNNSIIYGWCVYDRQTRTPAYDACAELLPPVRHDESGTIAESPVMLETEYKAMKLCSRLNVAHKRSMNQK